MTTSDARSLESELGERLPDGIGTLSSEDLTDIADRLHDAKLRQSQALDAAVDEALEIVPRLLRGTVRKILFG